MQARVPDILVDYFGVAALFDDANNHPVIAQSYTPGRGWKNLGFRKRVSISWLRKMRKAGATHVAIRLGNRVADFSISEILRGQGRPNTKVFI
jgi:hypothetical protein